MTSHLMTLACEQTWPQVVCRLVCSHVCTGNNNHGSDSHPFDHFLREALQVELRNTTRAFIFLFGYRVLNR